MNIDRYINHWSVLIKESIEDNKQISFAKRFQDLEEIDQMIVFKNLLRCLDKKEMEDQLQFWEDHPNEYLANAQQFVKDLYNSNLVSESNINERLEDFSAERKIKLSSLTKITLEDAKKLSISLSYKTSKCNLFEDIQDGQEIYFWLIKGEYVILIYVPSMKQYFKFEIPTTNDIARLFIGSQKKQKDGSFKDTQFVPKRLIVSTSNLARDIHKEENDYLLRETNEDFSQFALQIIKRDLNQILHPEKYGEFEYKHLRDKIDRAKVIEKMNFDYGRLVSSVVRKSKNQEHSDHDRIVLLSEKGIEFVIDTVDKVLVSFAFKDCYGLGFHYEYTSEDVKSIPITLVENCLQNDLKGYSQLDNDVVAT